LNDTLWSICGVDAPVRPDYHGFEAGAYLAFS
jgi:hypothetical protein